MIKFFRAHIFLLCFIPLFSWSQTPRADSLKRVLGNAQGDTMHVNMLGELAYIMRSVKPDSALAVGHQSYELAKEIHFDQKIDNILRVLGIIHFYANRTDSALWYFEKAEKLAEELNDQMTLASVVMNQATLYKSLKNTDKALEAYERALAIEKKRGNIEGEAAAVNNIGTIFLDQKKYEKAELYFLKGFEIHKELGAKPTIIIILINLGLTATFQDDLEKSMYYYEQALELSREIQDKEKESNVLVKMALAYKMNGQFAQSLDYYLYNLQLSEEMNSDLKVCSALKFLARLYEENGNLDMAETYLRRAIEISEKIEDVRVLASNLAGLGIINMKQEKFRNSLSYFHQALGIQEKTASSDQRVTANILQKMGSCYLNLGQLDSATFFLDKAHIICENFRAETTHIETLLTLAQVSEREGNFEQAISYAEEGLNIASLAGVKNLHSQTAEFLYRLYKKKDNSPKALAYLELHKNLQDSLFNKENTRALAQMEARHKFEQEKQQLSFEQEQKLNEEKNAQKAMWIALIVAILVILAFAWYYYQKQKANRILVGLNTEVSEQKRKLEEMDILKSRFFTNISHEFRTPLTVIGGMVDQIKSEPKKWTDKGLNLIQRNNTQLLDLVNQILDLRKLESGSLSLNKKQGDIVFYLSYVFESFQSLAESKDIALHFLCEMEELWMDFDREKMLRVISNLLSNAIRFTPEAGNIYLILDKSADPNQPSKEYLKLSIKDTGLGIPEDKLPYIFDRFYQVDTSSSRKGEGTGIGLALTKELVTLMEGEIRAESRLNKGSTFSLTIPISQEESIQEISEAEIQVNLPIRPKLDATAAKSNTSFPINPIKLLLIEDNADVVTYLESLLEDNYELLIARDGKEGIELAVQEVPDLIISDIMMPIKDGYEVCATLKEDERTSHIPIVLLTAKADDDSKLTGLSRGADAYLTKPFNKKELLIRLEQLQKLRQKLQDRYLNLEVPEDSEEVEVKQEDTFILKVRAVIEENMQNPDLGVDLLCEKLGLSRTQLYMKIKALTNRSATQYIRAIRLFKAKELLQGSEQAVSQIAYEVGFSDPSYFSRAFSKEFGFPPKNLTKK
ncbi:MAG: tetratricopeptide repeat protein [Bacteroidia bacterium]|nr:tetratricopeptide repeat protein [Bacteroidia bacterium]